MNLLIENVRVVDSFIDFLGCVYIENGIIKEVIEGEHEYAKNKDCEVLDGKGKVLMPSFIDMHAHFREPGYEYKEDLESGSKAAVKGGYTFANLMANTKPVCSSNEVLEEIYNKNRKVGLIDIHQCVSITKDFDGKCSDHLLNIDKKVKFISDDGKGTEDNLVMYKAMELAKEKDLTIISHAEFHDFVPIDTKISEDLMTIRDVYLAKKIGCKLHMAHVSTKDSMEAIINAKKAGAKVTCEVMPHHLIEEVDRSYRVNPPIRDKEDVEFIRKAIKDDVVDVIATDHAPHSNEDKLKGSPGISGIETSFQLCYTALVKNSFITLNKLSQLMSYNPARLMEVNKGLIEKGFEADLVLVDLDKQSMINSENFASKGKNTPFNGTEVFGEVIMTLRKGQIVYRKQ
ncbi:dihydroorotase [Clostridium sp. DL1XJH146]